MNMIMAEQAKITITAMCRPAPHENASEELVEILESVWFDSFLYQCGGEIFAIALPGRILARSGSTRL